MKALKRKALIFFLLMVCVPLTYCSRTIHYGWQWTHIKKPLASKKSMAGVEAFIRMHGWQMEKDGNLLFFSLHDKLQPLYGLPWFGQTKSEYTAITCDGILYVPLLAFGAESNGIAYNPHTITFPASITGFVPVGNGWYAWKQTAGPGEKRY